MNTVDSSPTGDTLDAAAAEQASRAAEAAVALLPVAAGAVAEPVSAAEVPDDWPVVVQRFTGSPSGWCALALEPTGVESLVAALAAAAGPEGGGDLAAACDPALRAATAAVGPVAGLDPEVTTLAGLPDEPSGPGVVTVRLAVAGEPAAYLLLATRTGAAPVPAPRGSQEATGTPGPTDPRHGLELLRSVPMEVTAEIGRTRMTIQDLLGLAPGAVVELDRPVGSPADVLVNGRLFARGEVVVVDEDFAIRITEIVDTTETAG